MDKNDSLTPQKKKENSKLTVILPLMIMATLLIIDLYVMIHMPGNYLVLAVVSLLFLISAYFFGNGILKEIQNSKICAREQYEAISKSGKASYILLKKAFEQLEEIEGNSKKPAEEIITAQKAIAKVTINRNKENTDALMNSNDKVLEKIFDFEENLGNNQNDLLDKQREMIDNSMKALLQQQQEIASNMRAMEESIKNELLQAMNSMQVVKQETVLPDVDLNEPEPLPDIDFSESEPLTDLDISDVGLDDSLNLGEDIGLGEELDLGDNIGFGEELNLGEDIGLEESIDLGESTIPADMDLGIDLLSEESVAEEPIEEPVMEEVVEEPAFEEPVAEEAVEEPVMEKPKVPMPDLSDPNKLMTPEEIAALIANM